MKQKFDVKGMMCASCVANVTNTIKKLNGVSFCEVSLTSNTALIDYDEKIINYDEIIDAINKSGYGCELHQNISIKKLNKQKELEFKKERSKRIISIVFFILLMLVSMGTMLFEHIGIQIFLSNKYLNFSLQILFLIPIIVVNFFYYPSGYKALFKLKPNMNSLVALGSTISLIYGLYSFVMLIITKDISTYSNQIYFESVGTILTFVSLGKYFEKKATYKTGNVISKLVELMPDFAIILKNNEYKSVPVEDIKENDLIVIKTGDSIPADGYIIEGFGEVNESMITGESIPVHKSINDNVVSGTINLNGSFIYKVTKNSEESTLNQIVKLVQEASDSKLPISKTVDKISSIFVPSIITISIICFVIWLFVSDYNIALSLNYAISVLVISCPCALGLATPLAIMVGVGKAAENGALIKSGEAFEKLNKSNLILLDKTGTVTSGDLKVTNVIGEANYLGDIISIEKLVEHPLAKAIENYKKIENKTVEYINYLPGLGVEATIGENNYIIGSFELISSKKLNISEKLVDYSHDLINKGCAIIYVSRNSTVETLFAITDSIRESSFYAIKHLKELDKKVVLLSGDIALIAKNVSEKLEINDFVSNVKPDEKLKVVEKYINESNIVTMVGDGINDAPALKKADIGVAIGAGTDVAIEAADIILARSNLIDLVNVIKLSKKVVINIKENLFWAFIYNIIMIPIAAGVFSNAPIVISLNPMIASIAMSLSSICVVLNALRLKLFKKI